MNQALKDAVYNKGTLRQVNMGILSWIGTALIISAIIDLIVLVIVIIKNR